MVKRNTVQDSAGYAIGCAASWLTNRERNSRALRYFYNVIRICECRDRICAVFAGKLAYLRTKYAQGMMRVPLIV